MIDSSFQCVLYTNKLLTGIGVQYWNEVFGIENVSLTHSYSYADSFILGGSIGPSQINSPIQTFLNIDKYYVDKEIFNLSNFSEPSCFYVFNGAIYYILTNAYLTDYSVSFSVGDIPKTTTKFSSYEYCINTCATLPTSNSSLSYGMSPCYTLQKINTSPYFPTNYIYAEDSFLNQTKTQPFTIGLDIPKLDSIFLSGNDALKVQDNQNIYAFDYSLSYNRQALFSVGDAFPIVKTVPPIKVSLSISSKVISETSSNFQKVIQDNLCFSVIVSGNQISNYCISGAKLVNQEIQISCCNILDYKRNYIGYLL